MIYFFSLLHNTGLNLINNLIYCIIPKGKPSNIVLYHFFVFMLVIFMKRMTVVN